MIKKLIVFRESKGLNPEQMASMIGVSSSYYYKVEQGTRNPSYNFILKIKSTFPDFDVNILISEVIS